MEARRGKRTPLDDQPAADSEVLWFVRAFQALSLGRPVGMSVGPIPLPDVVCFWRDVERIGPLREFIGVIRALDAHYLQEANKRRGSAV